MKVWTNGCFDLLHAGHISFLLGAKRLSDPDGQLVIGLNSDESVRRLKGKTRPIVEWNLRRYALLELFDNREVQVVKIEDDPSPSILEIGPGIVVKSSQWAGRPMPELVTIQLIQARLVFLPAAYPEVSETSILELWNRRCT